MMVVDDIPINVNNVLIENVEGYTHTWGNTAASRKRTGTKNHGRLDGIRQTLPAMTYSAETWTFTKQAQNKFAAAQTKMERSSPNIKYKDRRTNIWARERTEYTISNVRNCYRLNCYKTDSEMTAEVAPYTKHQRNSNNYPFNKEI